MKLKESEEVSKTQHEKFDWEGSQLTVSSFYSNREEDDYEEEASEVYRSLNAKGMVTNDHATTMTGGMTSQ